MEQSHPNIETNSPSLNAALNNIAMNPLVSEEIAKRIDDLILQHGLSYGSSRFLGTYGTFMWWGGCPVDWWQMCKELQSHGVDVQPIADAVREYQSQHR